VCYMYLVLVFSVVRGVENEPDSRKETVEILSLLACWKDTRSQFYTQREYQERRKFGMLPLVMAPSFSLIVESSPKC